MGRETIVGHTRSVRGRPTLFTDPTITLLRRTEFFGDRGRRELRTVARRLRHVSFAKGEDLRLDGDEGLACFVVAEGIVEVCVDDQLIAMVGVGGVLKDVTALGRGLRTVTVRGATPVSGLALTRQEFDCLLAECPSLAERAARTAGATSHRPGGLDFAS